MASINTQVVANSSAAVLPFIFKSVTSLVSTIIKAATEIREIARRVKANKDQCRQLSERIDIIVGFLQDKQFNDTLSEPVKVALMSFVKFLQECFEFINIFTNAGFLERLWENRNYSRRFTDLNTTLTQYQIGFIFGILLEDRLINKNQVVIFESGIWTYRRRLNEKWENKFHCQLIFDPNTKGLKGSGEDNFGRFKLNGVFCQQIRAIEMTWSYIVSNFELN
jgi:hypothetical protein